MSAKKCCYCQKEIAGVPVETTRGQYMHMECAKSVMASAQAPTTADRIRAACNAVRDMLIAKNASYGDSALRPRKVFGTGSAVDLLRVRIDDKLSRIANAPDAFGEDVIGDLIGYLILLKLALEDQKQARETAPQTAGGSKAPFMPNDPKNVVGYQGPDAMSVNYPCAGKSVKQIAREWDEMPQAKMPEAKR